MPLILPCGHTFCQDCCGKLGEQARGRQDELHRQGDSQRQGDIAGAVLTFACPTCRAPVPVDHGMIKNFAAIPEVNNLAAFEECKGPLPLGDISNQHSSFQLQEREYESE